VKKKKSFDEFSPKKAESSAPAVFIVLFSGTGVLHLSVACSTDGPASFSGVIFVAVEGIKSRREEAVGMSTGGHSMFCPVPTI